MDNRALDKLCRETVLLYMFNWIRTLMNAKIWLFESIKRFLCYFSTSTLSSQCRNIILVVGSDQQKKGIKLLVCAAIFRWLDKIFARTFYPILMYLLTSF